MLEIKRFSFRVSALLILQLLTCNCSASLRYWFWGIGVCLFVLGGFFFDDGILLF